MFYSAFKRAINKNGEKENNLGGKVNIFGARDRSSIPGHGSSLSPAREKCTLSASFTRAVLAPKLVSSIQFLTTAIIHFQFPITTQPMLGFFYSIASPKSNKQMAKLTSK